MQNTTDKLIQEIQKYMKINEKEKKVLKVLVEVFDSEANCLFFWYLAKRTKLQKLEVRRACRSLKKKGFVNYIRGLFDDDGMVAGSGYCATEEGVKIINPNVLFN